MHFAELTARIMFKRENFTSFGIIFLGAFVALTFFVKKGFFSYIDYATTVKVQDHLSNRFDLVLSAFSLLGSFEIMSIFLGIYLFLKRKLSSLLIFALYGLGHVIELLGKTFINHPGPPFQFFRYDLSFIFPTGYIQTGHSFPSGHSFRAVFLGLIVAYIIYTSRKIKTKNQKYLILLLMGILMAVMLLSRISLGEHWLSDVIGGSILGLSFAAFTLAYL